MMLILMKLATSSLVLAFGFGMIGACTIGDPVWQRRALWAFGACIVVCVASFVGTIWCLK